MVGALDWWLHLLVVAEVGGRRAVGRFRDAATGEAGEGVVSLAIGVVIMAFLGVMVWVAFRETLGHATQNVNTQVSQIGQ